MVGSCCQNEKDKEERTIVETLGGELDSQSTRQVMQKSRGGGEGLIPERVPWPWMGKGEMGERDVIEEFLKCGAY